MPTMPLALRLELAFENMTVIFKKFTDHEQICEKLQDISEGTVDGLQRGLFTLLNYTYYFVFKPWGLVESKGL